MRVAPAPGMLGTFSPAADSKGNRQLAIPACITARASCTCRDACRDRLPPVARKKFPAFPEHAHPLFSVSGNRPMVQASFPDPLMSQFTDAYLQPQASVCSLIARFMGPSWGPSGTDRTQVGTMLDPWTLLSGLLYPTQQPQNLPRPQVYHIIANKRTSSEYTVVLGVICTVVGRTCGVLCKSFMVNCLVFLWRISQIKPMFSEAPPLLLLGVCTCIMAVTTHQSTHWIKPVLF